MKDIILELIKLGETMNDKTDVEKFDNLLANFIDKDDERTLKEIFAIFNDKCKFFEVMFNVIHLVEKWPIEIYVKEFIEGLHTRIKIAPHWMDCLANRIFNDLHYLEIFRQNMHLASKETLLKLFDIMEEESPHHKGMIQELRKELDKA